MGVILYNLVTGVLPFDGRNYLELFQKIVQADYTIPEYLSPGTVYFGLFLTFLECKDLIQRMLQPEPSNRATMEEIQQHPWLRLQGTEKSSSKHRRKPSGSKGHSRNKIDKEIIKLLENFGFESPLESIMEDKYDQATAAYLLLCAKKKRLSKNRSSRSSSSGVKKQKTKESRRDSPVPESSGPN